MFTSRFLSDLEEGVFVQQTLEIVLFNEDGKQLLVRGLHVFSLDNSSRRVQWISLVDVEASKH